MIADPEYQMIEQLQAGQCSLEKALLVVSVLDERGIANYQRKLDQLQEEFQQNHYSGKGNRYGRAKGLFDYLKRPKPAKPSNHLFADVIDLHLASDGGIDCVGLTSLYTVLGVRLGLDLAVLYGDNKGPHILNNLSLNGKNIIIENTDPNGFDRAIMNSVFEKRDLPTLVSAAFNNRGKLKFDLGDLRGSLTDFDKALLVDPQMPPAYKNRNLTLQNLTLQGLF